MFDIIVSAKIYSENAHLAEPGHFWIVEGDYGYLASFVSETEAMNFAIEEAKAVKANVQLNA